MVLLPGYRNQKHRNLDLRWKVYSLSKFRLHEFCRLGNRHHRQKDHAAICLVIAWAASETNSIFAFVKRQKRRPCEIIFMKLPRNQTN